ncbi:hypothetical protein Verru16b_01787 [Lacunisphaera limnophila]|uniref:Acid-resistance membrane protein n=1 Tax=Lacunisphaera limnophila TaxID=1838286 RepID=A0A1D8AUZ7_9BACT|nr:hypothetical protein [Lacunisphaera limnophila]AOS44720.1 hypothetical protein Verru16b_01787 [Lacunisphaera limnophila]
MLTIDEAQTDMRHAYFGGATGLAASALVWLLAGSIALFRTPQAGVLALFFGGMLIHPLAVLGSKALGRPGAHARNNPLGPLALESTVILLLGMILAFGLSRYRVELFFPAMLIVIGGRYLTFHTLYGRRVYWLCGTALASLGLLAALQELPVAASTFGGAVIEAAIAAIVVVQIRRERKTPDQLR